MAIFEFEGRVPRIPESCYVDKTATIIGLVELGEECFIGPGARIKGDYGHIKIGDRTSVQENCVIHARPGCVVPEGISDTKQFRLRRYVRCVTPVVGGRTQSFADVWKSGFSCRNFHW